MTAGDSDPNAFAEAWLAQQARFWEQLRAQPHGDAYREARVQWSAACEAWRAALTGSIPGFMTPVVDAALDHTRLCVEFGIRVAEGQAPAMAGHWLLAPERLFDAAARAFAHEPAGAHAPVDEAQVRALGDAVDLIARIAKDTLATVRHRLERGAPDSPAALLEIYLEALESHYLAAASSDEFARVAGALVNSWVDAEAARRGAGT